MHETEEPRDSFFLSVRRSGVRRSSRVAGRALSLYRAASRAVGPRVTRTWKCSQSSFVAEFLEVKCSFETKISPGTDF